MAPEVVEHREGESFLFVTIKGIRVMMLGLRKCSVNTELNRCAAGVPRTLKPVMDSLWEVRFIGERGEQSWLCQR